jgi:Cu+-exporting ATPase
VILVVRFIYEIFLLIKHFSFIRDSCNNEWTGEILSLAAGVESNTTHPLGKAIMEAAQAANCLYLQAKDGSFMEEPGSGAVATIGEKQVSVGTLDWIRRYK